MIIDTFNQNGSYYGISLCKEFFKHLYLYGYYRVIAKTFSIFRFQVIINASYLFFLLLIVLLASCNLRENLLLPPEISAAEYQTGNTIKVYSDYLIKAANDDSYLMLHKESIADELIDFRVTKLFFVK